MPEEGGLLPQASAKAHQWPLWPHRTEQNRGPPGQYDIIQHFKDVREDDLLDLALELNRHVLIHRHFTLVC